MSRLIILTEGGEHIGFGHISRCSEVYKNFKEKGWDVSLYLDWRGESDIPLNQLDYQIFSWNALNKVLPDNDSNNICLVDSYLAGVRELRTLKENFKKVVLFDDFKRMNSFGVDLVINPNAFGDQFEYEEKYVGGKDYVILREEFVNNCRPASIQDDIHNIFISVGGSDYRNLLPTLAESFGNTSFNIEVVSGSDAYAKALSERFGNYQNFKFYGRVSAEALAKILGTVDLAISAGGQMLHELAFARIPTLGVCIDSDQVPNLNYYYNHGFLANVFEWDEPDLTEQVLKEIHQLDHKKRLKMAKIGKMLVDGKGVEAVYKKISEFNDAL